MKIQRERERERERVSERVRCIFNSPRPKTPTKPKWEFRNIATLL